MNHEFCSTGVQFPTHNALFPPHHMFAGEQRPTNSNSHKQADALITNAFSDFIGSRERSKAESEFPYTLDRSNKQETAELLNTAKTLYFNEDQKQALQEAQNTRQKHVAYALEFLNKITPALKGLAEKEQADTPEEISLAQQYENMQICRWLRSQAIERIKGEHPTAYSIHRITSAVPISVLPFIGVAVNALGHSYEKKVQQVWWPMMRKYFHDDNESSPDQREKEELPVATEDVEEIPSEQMATWHQEGKQIRGLRKTFVTSLQIAETAGQMPRDLRQKLFGNGTGTRVFPSEFTALWEDVIKSNMHDIEAAALAAYTLTHNPLHMKDIIQEAAAALNDAIPYTNQGVDVWAAAFVVWLTVYSLTEGRKNLQMLEKYGDCLNYASRQAHNILKHTFPKDKSARNKMIVAAGTIVAGVGISLLREGAYLTSTQIPDFTEPMTIFLFYQLALSGITNVTASLSEEPIGKLLLRWRENPQSFGETIQEQLENVRGRLKQMAETMVDRPSNRFDIIDQQADPLFSLSGHGQEGWIYPQKGVGRSPFAKSQLVSHPFGSAD